MFEDAESMVRKFLADRIAVPVSTRVPATRPVTFIRTWRTGGAATNRILDRPMITVEVWAPDSVTASSIAGRARDMLLGAYTGMPNVRAVDEVSGLYFDPDPDTGIDRYTFTVQLNVRATL